MYYLYTHVYMIIYYLYTCVYSYIPFIYTCIYDYVPSYRVYMIMYQVIVVYFS